MFDQIVLSLMNQISREGITDEGNKKLISLIDTLLYIDDYNDISITNIQTLILLLQDFEIKDTIKRLVNELKYKIIRQSLGRNWSHGQVATEYTINEMNRSILTKTERITVFEDGVITRNPEYSLQPLIPKDRLLLNDMGQLALNE